MRQVDLLVRTFPITLDYTITVKRSVHQCRRKSAVPLVATGLEIGERRLVLLVLPFTGPAGQCDWHRKSLFPTGRRRRHEVV